MEKTQGTMGTQSTLRSQVDTRTELCKRGTHLMLAAAKSAMRKDRTPLLWEGIEILQFLCKAVMHACFPLASAFSSR